MDEKTILSRLKALDRRVEAERSACADTASTQWRERCLVFMTVRTTIAKGGISELQKCFKGRIPDRQLERLWRDAETLWNELFSNAKRRGRI